MTEEAEHEVFAETGAPDDLKLLVQKLKEQPNAKSGNKSLREALGWSQEEERYWKAHGRAIDQGLIIPGRGKGGSVQLTTGNEAEVTTESTKQNELQLYEPAKEVIEQSWARSENYDEFVVAVTGKKGRAPTGGKWTRPDISILGIKAYPYLPRRVFDIVTFEIKPIGQTSVEGVFEALSHQQFATRSYCVFHISPDDGGSFQDVHSDANRILSTARKHGIGIISATEISDWETWDELLNAERVRPDPEQANRFIATCFSTETQQTVIKWHK